MSIDFYPTLLELTGTRISHQVDGVSLVSLLRGDGSLDRKSLYWHYPHYSNQGGFPGGAVRSGDWKLVERLEDGRTHLYNLADDAGERNDVADAHRELVTKMRDDLHAWYRTVDAKFLQAKPAGPAAWRPN
jgi:arylsulfatase A-like enzyme